MRFPYLSFDSVGPRKAGLTPHTTLLETYSAISPLSPNHSAEGALSSRRDKPKSSIHEQPCSSQCRSAELDMDRGPAHRRGCTGSSLTYVLTPPTYEITYSFILWRTAASVAPFQLAPVHAMLYAHLCSQELGHTRSQHHVQHQDRTVLAGTRQPARRQHAAHARLGR